MEKLKSFLSDAWEGIKETAKTAWENLVKVITDVFDGILDPIEKAINKIKGWIGDVMDGITGAKDEAASMDANAFGGPVTQGVPTLVGERGPEVFVPSQSGSIKTMDQVGGGGNFNITINSTVRNDQDTRNIALELEKLLSRNNLISKNGISVG